MLVSKNSVNRRGARILITHREKEDGFAVFSVYFTPKVYQYFNPKVYHFNLISKSVFLPVAVPPPEGKQAFLF